MTLSLPHSNVEPVEVRKNFEEIAKQLPVAMPACSVYRNTNQTLANNTDTLVTWDAEYFDSGDMHSTSTNPGRITAPTAGYYRFSATLCWAVGAVGVRRCRLLANGATQFAFVQNTPVGVGDPATNTIVGSLELAAAGYVELYAFHTQGANLNLLANNCFFQAEKISP